MSGDVAQIHRSPANKAKNDIDQRLKPAVAQKQHMAR